MSKVTICDWCKKPFDDDKLKPVVFPAVIPVEQANAPSGICVKDETFDLCTECNDQVLSRLRSQKVQLPAARQPTSDPFIEEEELEQEDTSERSERKANRRKQREADVWPEDREEKIAAIQRGARPGRDVEDTDDQPPPRRTRGKKVIASSGSAEHAGNKRKCPHMNKSGIQGLKMKNGIPWRKCLDCGKKIPMKRPDEKSFQAPPPGCTLKSDNSRRG